MSELQGDKALSKAQREQENIMNTLSTKGGNQMLNPWVGLNTRLVLPETTS